CECAPRIEVLIGPTATAGPPHARRTHRRYRFGTCSRGGTTGVRQMLTHLASDHEGRLPVAIRACCSNRWNYSALRPKVGRVTGHLSIFRPYDRAPGHDGRTP